MALLRRSRHWWPRRTKEDSRKEAFQRREKQVKNKDIKNTQVWHCRVLNSSLGPETPCGTLALDFVPPAVQGLTSRGGLEHTRRLRAGEQGSQLCSREEKPLAGLGSPSQKQPSRGLRPRAAPASCPQLSARGLVWQRLPVLAAVPEADGSRAEEAMAAEGQEGQDGRTCLCLASRSALPPHPPHPAPVRLCNNWKNRGLFVPLSLIKMRNNKLSIFFFSHFPLFFHQAHI